LEELLRGAALLDDLVQQLIGVEAEARGVQADLGPYLYDSYASGCAAIDAVAESRQDIGRVRQELVGISASVRSSYHDYVQTEVKNLFPRMLGLDEMKMSGVPWVPGRDITHNVVTSIIPPGMEARDIMRGLLQSPLVPGLRPRPVSIEKIDESIEHVDPSMAQSIRRLEQLHARGDGEIEIIQLHHGGSSSWMVLIPGTQPEAPDTNPFDIPGVGEALGYDSEEVVPAIGQALREAGAQAGEQVVAVGHSQGGAHAMNLSRNKAFLSEFDLRYVLTAGAPAGGISSEPGIAALHLEHVQDWVPGSDGRVNPDTKDRVTVTLNNDVKTPEGEDPGLGPGHRLENYAAGAELVAASRDTSLAASTAAFAGVVGVGGAARVTHFKLERSPLPDKRPGLRNPDLPETRSVAGAR
jgi:pimeloyl-ACP methyl ester carboxylesterase